MNPIILLVLLATTQAEISLLDEEWAKFKMHHKRLFRNSVDEQHRKEIFEKNLQIVTEHNERFQQGLESYEQEINEFSDKTEEELRSFTGLDVSLTKKDQFYNIKDSFVRRNAIPASFDWRSRGVVTPVKNQRNCGSCWAFAAVGALEAHNNIYRNEEVILSEQQLVDCVSGSSCNGGSTPNAFSYIAKNGGISYEKDYPYNAKNNACRNTSNNTKISIKGYANTLERANEELLRQIVATKGPTVAYIHVNNSFHGYKRGVYYSPQCNSTTLNHAVVVVGYGRQNEADYWLVKNSWGRNWGDKGYIKMARNARNHCGIANYGFYPVF